jgi:hypothetical protein
MNARCGNRCRFDLPITCHVTRYSRINWNLLEVGGQIWYLPEATPQDWSTSSMRFEHTRFGIKSKAPTMTNNEYASRHSRQEDYYNLPAASGSLAGRYITSQDPTQDPTLFKQQSQASNSNYYSTTTNHYSTTTSHYPHKSTSHHIKHVFLPCCLSGAFSTLPHHR